MARALETTFAESGTVLGKINGQPPIHLIGHSNGGGVVSLEDICLMVMDMTLIRLLSLTRRMESNPIL